MAKKVIRLTESDIANMIKESVDALIKEYMENGMENNTNIEAHLSRMTEALMSSRDTITIPINGYGSNGYGEGVYEITFPNGDAYNIDIQVSANETYGGQQGDGYMTPSFGPEYDWNYESISVHYWYDEGYEEEQFNIPLTQDPSTMKFLEELSKHIDVECDFEPYQREFERD